jgi:excisionase family DNA binding protein
MENNKLLTTREVAAFLKINEKKVYSLIQEGSIPCTRVVGKWLFPLDQINRWLEEQTELAKNILLAGSDDPLLLSLIEEFNRLHFPRHLVFHAALGSRRGLLSLAAGKSQIAGVHLFHPPTGEYNLPYAAVHLHDKSYLVVNLAYRRQGLLAARGNPLDIKGIADLARREVRFINRNEGSGTRYILDYQLTREGLPPLQINGYHREKVTHMEVGLMLVKNEADVGVGIEYIAKLLDLHFIPLVEERFDLVTMKDGFTAHPISDFFSLLEPEKLTLKTELFPGYDFRHCGSIMYP